MKRANLESTHSCLIDRRLVHLVHLLVYLVFHLVHLLIHLVHLLAYLVVHSYLLVHLVVFI